MFPHLPPAPAGSVANETAIPLPYGGGDDRASHSQYGRERHQERSRFEIRKKTKDGGACGKV
jgi:hypothetical protein